MFFLCQTSGRRYEVRDNSSHDAWAVCSSPERGDYIVEALNEHARTHPPFSPAEASLDFPSPEEEEP